LNNPLINCRHKQNHVLNGTCINDGKGYDEANEANEAVAEDGEVVLVLEDRELAAGEDRKMAGALVPERTDGTEITLEDKEDARDVASGGAAEVGGGKGDIMPRTPPPVVGTASAGLERSCGAV
jgi:hypothetical protein